MDRLSRLVLVSTPLALGLMASSASAQVQLEIHLPSEDDPDELIEIPEGDLRLQRFFNSARCECGDEFGTEFFVPAADTGVPESRPIEVWLGNDCADQELQDEKCGEPFDTFPDRNAIENPSVLRIPLFRLADPIDGICGSDEREQRVYALVDETGDGTYEVNDSLGISLDFNPPPAPDTTARGSEGGFVVEWELPDSRQDDFEFFQVLCANPDGSPVLDEPSDEPEYETPATLCNAAVEDENGNLLEGIDALDPEYICGDALVPADSIRVSDLPASTEGYRVIFVAVDPARNPTALDMGTVVPQPVQDFWEEYKDQGGGAEGGYCFVATATYGDYDHPHVVVLRNFRDEVLATNAAGRWLIATYYRYSPPLAALIASSPTLRFVSRVLLTPIVILAGLWVYTGLLGKLGIAMIFAFAFAMRRRRAPRREKAAPRRRQQPPRRLAIAAAAGLLATLVFANAASAQQEYLDELLEDTPPEHLGGPGSVKWNMEFRFGPFVPDVDDEFSGDGEGPFAEMFGDGPMFMTKLALERFFLYPGGQLGVSFGAGFLTTGADSYELDEMGNVSRQENGKPLRVDGERTNFRLFPLNVSAVYRFTGIDDRFRVPLVPYGKLGLAYTIWTVTKPDGSVAEAGTMDCPDPSTGCDGDTARGGSLGFDATLGLAIRAERLDPDTSVSLRNEMGIEHAGFFVELALSKVDGFGSDTKLSVGDLTWFGGFNFEF